MHERDVRHRLHRTQAREKSEPASLCSPMARETVGQAKSDEKARLFPPPCPLLRIETNKGTARKGARAISACCLSRPFASLSTTRRYCPPPPHSGSRCCPTGMTCAGGGGASGRIISEGGELLAAREEAATRCTGSSGRSTCAPSALRVSDPRGAAAGAFRRLAGGGVDGRTNPQQRGERGRAQE